MKVKFDQQDTQGKKFINLEIRKWMAMKRRVARRQAPNMV